MKTLSKLTLLLLAALTTLSMNAESDPNRLPRKVLVATSIFPHYGDYPGLEARLEELGALLDAMQARCQREHPGRRLDLMLLTEHAVTGGTRQGVKGEAAGKAMPWEGRIADFFAERARRYGSYIAVPMHEARNGQFYNSVILVDRDGKRAGTFDKCFPVVDSTWNGLENGITPGHEVPVFQCDFGRIGFQVCYDIENPAAWQRLADAGAELVGWCTASPQTILPRLYAVNHRYWIVSATPRLNATVFQPRTGFIHAQLTGQSGVLVSEIDLSTLYLQWMPGLRDGHVLRESFGDKVGFHYDEQEDCGLFWSNDPAMSIDGMAEAVGLLGEADRVGRSHQLNPHW